MLSSNTKDMTKSDNAKRNNQAIKKALLKLQSIELELAGVKELLENLENEEND